MQKPQKTSENTKPENASIPGKSSRIFVMTDLKSWTFKLSVGSEVPEYSCFDEDAPFGAYAETLMRIKPEVDWQNLAERANFMTRIWALCQERSIHFPFIEKMNDEERKLTKEA